MPVIAILSTCADLSAHLLHHVLVAKGAEVAWLQGGDFPNGLTLSIGQQEGRCESRFEAVDATGADDSVRSVWVRRAVEYGPFPEAFARLSTAEARIARGECIAMRRSFLGCFARSALWVNPWDRIAPAENKALQLRVAAELGFQVPATLMSNCPQRIRAFIRQQGGAVAYKGFGPLGIDTTAVSEADLPEDDALVRMLPGIYQQIIAKACELRVTVVGQRVFAYRIDSQSTQKGRLDWRAAYDEIDVAATSLPSAVEQRCMDVCRSLGLAYGALDLVRTPTGEYVFLEVNESGQFVFLENMAARLGNPAHPIVDALAEMLVQGRTDYVWDPGSRHLWGDDPDFHRLAIARRQQMLPLHTHPPEMVTGVLDGSSHARFIAGLEARRHSRSQPQAA